MFRCKIIEEAWVELPDYIRLMTLYSFIKCYFQYVIQRNLESKIMADCHITLKFKSRTSEYFAGETLTRRPQSRFLVFINRVPLFCFFKRQLSMKTSSFGSEFLVMR